MAGRKKEATPLSTKAGERRVMCGQLTDFSAHWARLRSGPIDHHKIMDLA
jgi:hypothetical protein